MEGNKNAMYAQAGRSNGWKVISGEAATNVPEMKAEPVKFVAPPAPELMREPVPAPPVVIVPEVKASAKDCQVIAMAYVESQKWQELYEPEQGFSRGTLFTELDLPFVGEGACKHG